jgi:DNA invertase Pin-like site-specific DNA recombinase
MEGDNERDRQAAHRIKRTGSFSHTDTRPWNPRILPSLSAARLQTGYTQVNQVNIRYSVIRLARNSSFHPAVLRLSRREAFPGASRIRLLKAAGCRHLFEEAASGGRWDRPELHCMLDHLRNGDTVVVWKLDRLPRSLKDVLHIMERIAMVGAGFRSITENIDTTTPAGRMMMRMVGSFAEFERAMIREWTSADIVAARAEGRVGGRRPKLTAAQQADIAKNVRSGRNTAAQMARLSR